MRDETFEKAAGRAAEACRRFELGDEAVALLTAELAPKAFLDLLVQAELYNDAVRFLAHALPRREAVWWACQCVASVEEAWAAAAKKDAEKAKLQAEAKARLAAEHWAANPSEDNRRAAFAAAKPAEAGTPGGCVALAAFFSGGSLAPPKLTVVPPAEHLTPTTAANAVLMAAVRTEPEKAAEKYKAFCALGVAVADGTDRWTEEKPAPAKAAHAAPVAPRVTRPPLPPRRT